MFRGAFEYSGIGMALVEPDGRFRRVNRELCCILGYDETQFASCDSRTSHTPSDLEAGLAGERGAARRTPKLVPAGEAIRSPGWTGVWGLLTSP